MPARPAKPKPPPPPKPWRREDGRYRSDDQRFTIESGGAGRWFLTDDESLDELGLARTLGPFDTLDEAKDAAAAQRAKGAEASPLAERLAAAKDRPTRATTPPAPTTGRGAPAKEPPAPATAAARPEPEVEPAGVPEPAAVPEPAPPPRTWLDDLEDDDRDAAVAARRTIAALEDLGVADADAIVRRDVLGRQPAVAAQVLGRALATALRERLGPEALARDARTAIPGPMRELRDADDAALAAYAAFVAARVLETTLDIVAGAERAPGAATALPGWRLVERPATRGAEPRRLIVTPADVTEG